jgi:hypothetical protein
MTITPTPEQIAIAELNGWDPQEAAVTITTTRTGRLHAAVRDNARETRELRSSLDGLRARLDLIAAKRNRIRKSLTTEENQ